MDPTIQTFGERLRQARIAAGLTQQALATKLGVAVVTISRWERDLAAPFKTDRQLARVLKTPWPFLLNGEMPEPKTRKARVATSDPSTSNSAR